MAFRIQVTAVRGASEDEVRTEFAHRLGPTFSQVPLTVHGGWTSFRTSVWHVNATDLNRGICALARPGLQFTTVDGCLWILTVHGAPGGQRHFIHQFGYHSNFPDPADDASHEPPPPEPIDPRLAFLQEDGPRRPPSPFDTIAEYLAGMGAPVSEGLRDALIGVPYSQAMRRYHEWHVAGILEALTDAGIPHDPAAVRRVLSWEETTDRESDSDLGNLPRLLKVLGLGGEWDDYIREAENPSIEQPDCAVPEESGEAVPVEDQPPPWWQRLADVCAELPMAAIPDGPAIQPCTAMYRVGFFADTCAVIEDGMASSSALTLDVLFPPGCDRPILEVPNPQPDQCELTVTPEGFRLRLCTWFWLTKKDIQERFGKELKRLLFVRPIEGTVYDIAVGYEGQRATYHRYRGAIHQGAWHVTECSHRFPAGLMNEAFEVAAKYYGGKITARDEAEAEQWQHAIPRDGHTHDMDVKRKGLNFKPDFDVGHFSGLVFRLRYGSIFDLGPANDDARRLYEESVERQRRMRRAMVEASRQRAAPHDPKLLLVGNHTRFWRSDFAQLDQLPPEPRHEFDDTMTSLGFRHIGDLVAKKQRDMVVRIWLSPDGYTYAALMAKRTMYLGQEYRSRFSDGSWLTTVRGSHESTDLDQNYFVLEHPRLDLRQLHERHAWAIDRFRDRKGTEPLKFGPELIDAARFLDENFGRLKNIPSDDESTESES